jgi:hypothetical protein
MAAKKRRLFTTRWFGMAVLVILVALQFKPVDRSNPPIQSELRTPDEVGPLLRRACYDCHSNQTRWPWYSYVAPVSWFVTGHVEHARRHLNFTEWPVSDLEEQEDLFEEIHEEVSEGNMPLWSYTLMHRDARLTVAERDLLLQWASRSGRQTGDEERD